MTLGLRRLIVGLDRAWPTGLDRLEALAASRAPGRVRSERALPWIARPTIAVSLRRWKESVRARAGGDRSLRPTPTPTPAPPPENPKPSLDAAGAPTAGSARPR